MTCPFCDARIGKPEQFSEQEEASGGRCQCGALFITDVTGKAGGEALMQGLTLLCAGDMDRALGLTAGKDYEMTKRGYQPRTHSLERRLPPHGAFGHAKLWFFRLLHGASS